MKARNILENKKRIVIKVGSSSLTHKDTGHISIARMELLVRQIADIKNAGKDVILVSSGAIAVGISALNMKNRPESLSDKQAVAAVGQASLMMIYQKLFREYNKTVGQVLITKDLLEHEGRKNNTINTFNALLKLGAIPIVNENDTVSTEEIEFGDNDNLSAIVACLIEADLLIILSDIDGLFNSDPSTNPDASIINEVMRIDDTIENMATDSISKVGTGGMITKIQAAKLANEYGIDTVIANSETDHVIYKIMKQEPIGTIFYS
ncbi:MAG: glutamate 5-kinase [Firmicutes bacterium HGW-Firmicutes-7]|nr:MAG: glutamate 5-kinase [Firmicutes bacterium HGW-Firmicutes-7]